jgi:hypothetical protein
MQNKLMINFYTLQLRGCDGDACRPTKPSAETPCILAEHSVSQALLNIAFQAGGTRACEVFAYMLQVGVFTSILFIWLRGGCFFWLINWWGFFGNKDELTRDRRGNRLPLRSLATAAARAFLAINTNSSKPLDMAVFTRALCTFRPDAHVSAMPSVYFSKKISINRC